MGLISREEAIQELEFICENKILSKEGTYALCIALDEMKSNSRPKGKWIDFKCSHCGFEPIIKPMAIDLTAEPRLRNTYKYCPNCGANMRGEE